jgi:hypothetical protein
VHYGASSMYLYAFKFVTILHNVNNFGSFRFTGSKMASQTQGIQQLLAAEKKAAEKVIRSFGDVYIDRFRVTGVK